MVNNLEHVKTTRVITHRIVMLLILSLVHCGANRLKQRAKTLQSFWNVLFTKKQTNADFSVFHDPCLLNHQKHDVLFELRFTCTHCCYCCWCCFLQTNLARRILQMMTFRWNNQSHWWLSAIDVHMLIMMIIPKKFIALQWQVMLIIQIAKNSSDKNVRLKTCMKAH